MSTPHRPDNNSVSHEAIAAAAHATCANLLQQLVIKDAQYRELSAYAQSLEQRVTELESSAAQA